MKKINLKVAAFLLIGSLAASSCIGSYSLFNKFAKWETQMTSSKFVNAVIGFIITPLVAPICLVIDSLVLNTIEFWSGSNPVASNVGKTQQVLGNDGRYYAVTTLKNGYEVKAPDGAVTLFTHNAENDSWSMTQDGITKEIFRFNGDGTIQTVINGEEKTFSLNEQGVYDARMAAGEGQFFAAR